MGGKASGEESRGSGVRVSGRPAEGKERGSGRGWSWSRLERDKLGWGRRSGGIVGRRDSALPKEVGKGGGEGQKYPGGVDGRVKQAF